MVITEANVLALLEAKHTKDLFIPHCKVGPSQATGCPVLDGWAMMKSWANLAYIGYEIKVSRQDFLRDTKWKMYLPFCNCLYFVTAPGVVRSCDEIPEGVGWLEATKNCKRLLTRTKAQHRNIDCPEDLFVYVLMWRTEVVSESRPTMGTGEYWEDWLEHKRKYKDVGYRVSARLRQEFNESVDKVKHENGVLKENVKRLEQVQEFCDSIGLSLRPWVSIREQVEKKLADICGNGLVQSVDQAILALEIVKEKAREVGCEHGAAITTPRSSAG